MRRFLALVLIAGSLACGGDSGGPTAPSTPTQISPPTPAPTPTPNPFAAACGSPLPALADSYGYGIKVQLEPTRNKKILNASPFVRNSAYCQAALGITAVFCNTRPEGSPERVPCDHYVSGISDAGRPGPNWFQEVSGRLLKCGGVGDVPEEAPGCRLKEENQYLLDIYEGGIYIACGGRGSAGTCGGCVIDQSTFGTIHRSPAGLCRSG